MEESPNKINAEETCYFIAKPKAEENRSFSKLIHTQVEYLKKERKKKKKSEINREISSE